MQLDYYMCKVIFSISKTAMVQDQNSLLNLVFEIITTLLTLGCNVLDLYCAWYKNYIILFHFIKISEGFLEYFDQIEKFSINCVRYIGYMEIKLVKVFEIYWCLNDYLRLRLYYMKLRVFNYKMFCNLQL